MIDHLHIKNFLAFPELDVPELKLINLVAGKNGVGKSTLLEALLLKKTSSPKSVAQRIGRKRVANILLNDPQKASHLTWQDSSESSRTFKINDLSGTYFTIEPDGLVITPIANESERFEKRDESESVVYVQSTTKYEIISSLWDRIALTPEEHIAKVILKSILGLNVSGISISNNRIKILLEGQDRPVNIESLGEGANRALLLSLSIASAHNGLLLIDEVENHLHFSIIREFWKTIFTHCTEWNIQVVATTHSQDAIREFWYEAAKDSKYQKVSQVLRLQIGREGKHEVIQFPFERLDSVMEMEMEIR